MGERVSWIAYKGKEILYVDFSGIEEGDELIRIINEAKKEVLKNEHVLLLFNIVGSRGSPNVISAFKGFLGETKEKVDKDAVYLASNVHKIFLKAVRAFTGMTLMEFDSLDKAKDYLVG